MDNITFIRIATAESKIIHINGKIIYFKLAVNPLILHPVK